MVDAGAGLSLNRSSLPVSTSFPVETRSVAIFRLPKGKTAVHVEGRTIRAGRDDSNARERV